LGILPLGDQFSLFARLGVNFWNVDISAVGTGGGATAAVSDDDDGTIWSMVWARRTASPTT